MRLITKWNDEPTRFMAYGLCSQDGIGDYECFPNRELVLNLAELSERLERLGFDIEGVNEQICLAHRGRLQLTAFPVGRMILEGVSPDEPARALELMADVLDLKEVDFEE